MYCPSRLAAGPNMMKNWLLALFGSAVRAAPTAPRRKRRLCVNSAGTGPRSLPPVPVPVGSPPCAMNPSITRWNGVPS